MHRCDLDENELVDTARGICGDDRHLDSIEDLFEPAAAAYSELYQTLGTSKEFFGLRDFYAFIKLLVHFAKVQYTVTGMYSIIFINTGI